MRIIGASMLAASILLSSCTMNNFFKKEQKFVKVENGKFTVDGKPYTFLGTNFGTG